MKDKIPDADEYIRCVGRRPSRLCSTCEAWPDPAGAPRRWLDRVLAAKAAGKCLASWIRIGEDFAAKFGGDPLSSAQLHSHARHVKGVAS